MFRQQDIEQMLNAATMQRDCRFVDAAALFFALGREDAATMADSRYVSDTLAQLAEEYQVDPDTMAAELVRWEKDQA